MAERYRQVALVNLSALRTLDLASVLGRLAAFSWVPLHSAGILVALADDAQVTLVAGRIEETFLALEALLVGHQASHASRGDAQTSHANLPSGPFPKDHG